MNKNAIENQECCPEFNVEKWDRQHFKWENKRFIRDKVFTFFFIPLGFGSTMKRIMKKMKASGVNSKDWMCLSNHSSRWKMDVYVDVDGIVTNAKNEVLSGDFYSRVYEGPYRDTQKWCDDYEADIESQEMKLNTMYMWYVYCPNCAKKYGKNYVTIMGNLDSSKN